MKVGHRASCQGVAACATLVGVAIACATTSTGCKRATHARLAAFTPPPLPAGFAEQRGSGWQLAVPSTWRAAQTGPAAWAVADPHVVDGFHANVNVTTEPFAGESYDYARANEAALRREPRATVEVGRDEVVDGDPTLVFESLWAPASPATVAYESVQTALASRGTGYVVSCSVATTAIERYRSTCESIVRSFAVER